MATGIVATLGNSMSVTYTPTKNAKVNVNYAGWTNDVSINGVMAVFTSGSVNVNGTFSFYAADNVPVRISTGSNMTAIISALETN